MRVTPRKLPPFAPLLIPKGHDEARPPQNSDPLATNRSIGLSESFPARQVHLFCRRDQGSIGP
jgi:hypothetical protein